MRLFILMSAIGCANQASPPMDGAGLTVLQLRGGGSMTCALRLDHTVWCWGGEASSPTLIPELDQVSEISVSDGTACALKDNGEVWCWGNNYFGQLGNGTTTERIRPAKSFDSLVELDGAVTRAKHVHAAYVMGCVLTEDQHVFCWGLDDHGSLGSGSVSPEMCGDPGFVSPCRASPSEVRLSDTEALGGVDDVGVGGGQGCALIQGQPWCWGENVEGQVGIDPPGYEDYPAPVPVAGLAGVQLLAVYNDDSCAVGTDGAASCWGGNRSGQLGIGWRDAPGHPFPQIVPGLEQDVIAFNRQCAIKADHSLWCWGKNDRGQVGDGTIRDRFVPVRVLEDVATVAPGESHACAEKLDGTLWCWGTNGVGELGLGFVDENAHPTPTQLAPLP